MSYEVDVGRGLWSRHCDQLQSAAAGSPDERSSRADGSAAGSSGVAGRPAGAAVGAEEHSGRAAGGAPEERSGIAAGRDAGGGGAGGGAAGAAVGAEERRDRAAGGAPEEDRGMTVSGAAGGSAGGAVDTATGSTRPARVATGRWRAAPTAAVEATLAHRLVSVSAVPMTTDLIGPS